MHKNNCSVWLGIAAIALHLELSRQKMKARLLAPYREGITAE